MSKTHAVGDGRMVVIPEHHQTAWIRIVQREFSQHLEGMRAGLLRIGIDAVRDLQAVDVGIMLKLAAESAVNGPRDNAHDRKYQHQHGYSGPVAELAHVPASLKTRERPSGQAVENIKANEQPDRGCGDADHNMVEDVVSHLMAEHEERLRSAGFLDGRVPDYHPFASPQPPDL